MRHMAMNEATRNIFKARWGAALDAAAAMDDGNISGARKATNAAFQLKAIAEEAIEAFRRIEDGKDAD